MTQRIEFLIWVKDFNPFFKYAKSCTLFLSIRRKELNPFSLNMTQRNEHLFLSCDSKNWNIWSRNMTQRIEPCVKKKNRLKEWNFFKGLIELNLFLWTSSQYDSKNWTFEPCVKKKLREWNSFKIFFWNDS